MMQERIKTFCEKNNLKFRDAGLDVHINCRRGGHKIRIEKDTGEWWCIERPEYSDRQPWDEQKILDVINDSNSESENELFINTAPDDMRPEAYHGIFGEIVNSILPYTEADPKALLMNTITMIGNMIGKRACYRINTAEIHYPHIFYVQVGDTGVGRKGTAWNNI